MPTTTTHYTQNAPEHSRFMPGCFDSQLGRTVPLKDGNGDSIGRATLREAVIAEDGLSAEMTMEFTLRPESYEAMFGSVTNSHIGTVHGTQVQARDIHGGLAL